ncbi:ArsR/SmtB family transcription factor [Salinifilum ghardaiensis]
MLMQAETAAAGGAPQDPATDGPLGFAELMVKLFGDSLRAEIVRLLAREQMCTCHLVDDTGARQSTISHHLRILREAGFVAAEPHGRYTYYRLRTETLSEMTAGLANLTAQAHQAQAARRPCA